MANLKNAKSAQPKPSKSEEATARSAAALRENLKRRKAKARDQSAIETMRSDDNKTQ